MNRESRGEGEGRKRLVRECRNRGGKRVGTEVSWCSEVHKYSGEGVCVLRGRSERVRV